MGERDNDAPILFFRKTTKKNLSCKIFGLQKNTFLNLNSGNINVRGKKDELQNQLL